MKKNKRIQGLYDEMDPIDIKNDLKGLKDKIIKNYLLSNCVNGNVPLKNFMGEFEKEMISRALRLSGGSQRIASFILGIKPTTLNEKIKKYKIKDTWKIRGEKDLKDILENINISLL